MNHPIHWFLVEEGVFHFILIAIELISFDDIRFLFEGIRITFGVVAESDLHP